MPVVRHADPAKFLAAARGVIARDEAEGMMLESRVRALGSREAHGAERLYLATASGRAKGAAFQVDAAPLSVGASDGAAATAFADDLAHDHPALQGVYGLTVPCLAFARRWQERTGRQSRVRFRLRHHVLSEVAALDRPPGRARVAGTEDLDWLVAAARAFIREARIPDPRIDVALRHERGIARGLYWIWEDGGRVAYAGWNPATETSARIGPVYTEPASRGRGYATAVVAALAGALLESGYARLSLSADLANPVSNAVYARIGFRPTSEALHLDFVDGAE